MTSEQGRVSNSQLENREKSDSLFEDDDVVIQRINSRKLANHLYSRHSNDFFAYLNLSLSTFVVWLLGHSVGYPTQLNWFLGWTASEFGQVYLVLQALNLYRVFRYHPRVFQTFTGRLLLLINGWSASAICTSIVKGFNARAEFSQALMQQKIQPRAGESSRGYATLLSLIPLFLISRRGKQLQYRNNIPYGEMREIDPHLFNTWERTPPKLQFLHQVVIRGKISEWMSLDVKSLPGVKNAPVYVHIHGGGWVVGDKFWGPHALSERIASRGIVSVIVNYRMSPDVVWPAHIQDCKRAIIFIKATCASWGGDPSKVFVGGESAGGHLSAMVGVTANVSSFQPPELPAADTSVVGVIPIYGVFDFTDQYGYQKARSAKLLEMPVGMRTLTSRIVMQTRFTPESKTLFDNASPTFHLTQMLKSTTNPNLPPFLIPRESLKSILPNETNLLKDGTNDWLAAYEDSKAFYDELQKIRAKWGTWAEGESDVFATIEGALHAFGYWPSMRAHAMGDAITDFIFHHSRRLDLQRHIKPQEAVLN